MKLNIGETIKRLRKERDITQEEFSEVLGVSCQSVSRWENGTCYPDIELVPTIAAFFGISTDKLMGIDEMAEKQAVECYLQDFQKAISVGDVSACIRIAREGVAEFPNNYALLNKLMYALFVAGSDDADIPDWKENLQKYDAEIVALGERIIKYCPDTEIRFEATCRLAFQHCEMGRRSQGRAIYDTLPSVSHGREMAIWWALTDEEKLSHTREFIGKAYTLLFEGLRRLTHLVNHADAISVFARLEELERMMCDGELYPGTWHNCNHNFLIAKHYMHLQDTDKAMEHLQMAAAAAITFDHRPEQRKTVSLLLGEQTDKRSDFDTADSRPLCEILRDSWLAASEFDAVRNTDAFQAILEKIK